MFKNKNFKIKIIDYLTNDYAHNPDLGEKIGQYILKNNDEHKNIDLDFNGVKTINTAFCNSLLKVLYDDNYIKNNNIKIILSNYNDLILATFQKVVQNVKEKENDIG